MSEFRIDQITNQSGSRGPDIAGITTFTGTSGMVMPSGATEYRGGRGRGLFGGGSTPGGTNTIQYITISTQGDSKDFGDLTTNRLNTSSSSSSTRGLYAGGRNPSYTNSIDYITISATGNAFDFGDLSTDRAYFAGCSNSTRSVFGGGFSPNTTPTYQNFIEYVEFSSLGNSISFGSLTDLNSTMSACASSTRGIFAGGSNPLTNSSYFNSIDYITISTTGNAEDFGDLTQNAYGQSSCSNSIRGLIGGGTQPSSRINVIDYITLASLGNAIDFGDLNNQVYQSASCSSEIRGIFAGGANPSPSNVSTIDFVTISSTGDASSFGNLVVSNNSLAGCSDAHGGLGD